MINEQLYIDLARQELLNPTLALTKQHFPIIEPMVKIGQLPVARINFDHSESQIAVYFPIKDERFFIVVNLTKEPEIKADWVWVESGHRVYLTATSEHFNFEELSDFLTLKPLTGWSKGDLKSSNNHKYKFSRVSFEPNKNQAYDLEEKLNELLTILEKDKESVLRLSQNSFAIISVVKYQYINANAGIHFDINTINRMQKLNLGIDIDTYISGKPILD